MEAVFAQTQKIREASEVSLREMRVPPLSLVADLRRVLDAVIVAAQPKPTPVTSTDEYESLEVLRGRGEEELQVLEEERLRMGDAGKERSLSELQKELLEQASALSKVGELKQKREEAKAEYDTRKQEAGKRESDLGRFGRLNVSKQLKVSPARTDCPANVEHFTEPLFFIFSELDTWKDGSESFLPFRVDVVEVGADAGSGVPASVHSWKVVAKFSKMSVAFAHLTDLGAVSVKAWNDDGDDCGRVLESLFPEAEDGTVLPTLEGVYHIYKVLGRRCDRIESEWYPEEVIGRPYTWAQMLAGIQPTNVYCARYVSVLEFLEAVNPTNHCQ